MSVMRRFALLLVFLLPGTLRAQGTTRDAIERAIALYEGFQVEAARYILQQIVSPGYLQQVTPAERVTAYKYLGASYALVDKKDSASLFFIAALDFDPFTDLDLEKFSPPEFSAFNEAKSKIFKVGVKPIVNKVVNPALDTSAYVFRVITTSRASLATVAIINQADTSKQEILLQQSNDGERRLRWLGVLRNGQYADTGIYMIRMTATPASGGQQIQDQQLFRIEHAYEPLEDSLPAFTADQLLQEQIPVSAPYVDLIKGVVTGGIAYGLAALTMNSDVSGWQPHAISAAAISLGAGMGSFFFRRANRNIAANVAENARRQRERAAFNAAIKARNDARLERRLLIFTPVAGR